MRFKKIKAKPIKNKEVIVKGVIFNCLGNTIQTTDLRCIITNDAIGKTLSIDDGKTQFTIPFEPLQKFLI